MTTTTNAISKTAKKYLAIIETGHIEENELIALKSFLNNPKNKELRQLIFDAMSEKELTLSASQNQKGYDFLMNQWKTPRGIERKNNPFGYREQAILETFRDFTVKNWYDAGNVYMPYYLPLFSCNSKDGGSFEYYYNGKVNITG